MNEFPPRDRLIQVAGSLIRRLPEQFGELLAAARFEDGRGAIGRLSRPEVLAAAASATAPEEARWLAERMLQRWALIDEVRLEPTVAITGPGELWLCGRPREVIYEIAALDVQEGWTAHWTGDAREDEDGRRAVLTAHPPQGEEEVTAKMTVRVMGRAEGRRCVLAATRTVRLRRPVISIDESRRRLVVSDHTGEPAAGVEVQVADHHYTTQRSGLLDLQRSMGEDVVVRVGGEVVR